MKKTILITGGNGFLGSNLVKLLLLDYSIIVLEHKDSNLYNLQSHIEQIKTYRFNYDKLDKIFSENKVNYIIHTATDYGRGINYSFVPDTNLIMPLKLLESAIQNKVECFINTDTVLDRFVSDYALSKNQFREWLFHKQHFIKAVNIKLEHFYGPGAGNYNFITMMINRLLSNEKEIELTNGEQKRDFVYYTDVLEAYKIILENLPSFSAYSEFGVCTGKLITIKELVETLKKITGSNSELLFGALEYRPNELMISQTDNSSLMKLGWSPKVNGYDGLYQVVEEERKKRGLI